MKALLLAFVLSACSTAQGATPVAWMPYAGPFVSLTPGGVVPAQSGAVLVTPSTSPTPPPSPARTPHSATPAPKGSVGTAYIQVKGVAGIATYYTYHRGQAAAAARLRAYLGPGWRGETVTVCHESRCLRVILSDYESSTIPGRLVDLDVNDWAAICGDPARGVCDVVVSHG